MKCIFRSNSEVLQKKGLHQKRSVFIAQISAFSERKKKKGLHRIWSVFQPLRQRFEKEVCPEKKSKGGQKSSGGEKFFVTFRDLFSLLSNHERLQLCIK